MLILSPEERAQAWHDAVSAEKSERDYKRNMLASAAFQMIGSELSLYSDRYAAAFKESFGLLDESGLIGRDELRHAFEELDEERGTARAFVASLARHLRETAGIERLPVEARDRAFELSEDWRTTAGEGISASIDDGEEYVSVAEVAAVYDVTPQAVYKWIHKGAIEARSRPGGSYQIPLRALQGDERFDVARARRLQVTLERRHEGQPEVSSDEMLRQMRSRRPTSR
ncbi:MAG TPA: helix-turn-helix domain-containing protein [Solirubrobacter sp.]